MESVQQVVTYDTLNIFELVLFLFSDYPYVNDFYNFVAAVPAAALHLLALLDDYIGDTIDYVIDTAVLFSNFFYKHTLVFEKKLGFVINDIYAMCVSYNGFILFFGFFVFTNVLSFFFQNYLGMYGIFFFNLIPLLLFWLSLCRSWLFFVTGKVNAISVNLGQWALINLNYKIEFYFYIDSLSYSFIFLTTTIAFFVYLYAFAYFRYEPHVDRLLIFLNLFVISMIILVSAGNLIILFLGWELIGLTSFFLINFWTTKISTLKAAFKAFLFNRLSDVMLFFVCVFTFYLFHDLTNSVIIDNYIKSTNLYYGHFSVINIFSFFIIIPICIKSAQFFWHIWLPDSMEAPVPASALIHSATLVSAGIYLILRFKSILILSEYAITVLPLIGAFTACLGALSSAFQTDAKRLLAYSTISHCGFLVVSAICCDSEYTIFYLYVHGFFKAASFICVGNVIRFNAGYQDIRCMGGYAKYLPFECFTLTVCLLVLAGAPFTFGFFMKHFLLASIPTLGFFSKIVTVFLFVAACLGVVYCSRLYYGIFFGNKRSNKFIYTSVSKLDYYRFDTNGTFYTNTTIGAALAISGLMCAGLIICWIFFLIIYNKFTNTAEFNSNVISVALHALKYYTSQAALFNFGLLNVAMILTFVFVCTVSFVWVFSFESIFETFGGCMYIICVIIIILNLLWVV